MDNFILLSPFLTLCCISVVQGGAVPVIDVRGRSSETVQDVRGIRGSPGALPLPIDVRSSALNQEQFPLEPVSPRRATVLEFAGPRSQAAHGQEPLIDVPVSPRRALLIGPRSSAVEDPFLSLPVSPRSALTIGPRNNAIPPPEEISPRSIGVPIESRSHALLPEEEIIAKSIGALTIGPRSNAIPPPEEQISPRSLSASPLMPIEARSGVLNPEQFPPEPLSPRSALDFVPIGPRSSGVESPVIFPPVPVNPRSVPIESRSAPLAEEEIIAAKSIGALTIGPRSNAIPPPEEISPRSIGAPPLIPIEARSNILNPEQFPPEPLSPRSALPPIEERRSADSALQSLLEESLSARSRNEPIEGKRRHHMRSFDRRRFGGVSDMRARTSYLKRRDELMERLRLELQEWHDKRHGYVNPRGVGGKSLLSSVSTIVSLMNTLLPWFGIRPPQPMSSGGGMMSSSGGMMSGSGQMMSGSGGNIVLGPLYPYNSGVLVPYTPF